MRPWIIPLRTSGIILLFLIGNDLFQNQNFSILFAHLPYMVGVSVIALAVEYARVYGVKLPTTNKKAKTTLPLIFPDVKGGVK